ncbi:MAG: Uma2 family endonuclease [Deltaproteobacteria bacterium]|nr:Uma2 family endonuclease [Deltaproteobacteria bacterium]
MHVEKNLPYTADRPRIEPDLDDEVEYPDSDGQPMADNTKQFDFIVLVKLNIDDAIPDFVAGNILWYPQKGNPKTRAAPDVLVALGRPKGYRGSYKQWEEDGVAPQVVFEVLSPGNRFSEMVEKHLFYEGFGVEEYYVIDPEPEQIFGFVRQNGKLVSVASMVGFVSPRLGIRFEPGERLVIRHRDGTPFTSRSEERMRAELAERQRAEAEQQLADAEQQLVDAERQRAEAERQKLEARQEQSDAERRSQVLRDQLRSLGIEPAS